MNISFVKIIKMKKDLENIKSKLIKQIKENYSEAQAKDFILKINSMDSEGFIQFLKEQGLIGKEENKESCIFCSIIFGDVPSTKIGENEKAIAILDINPASLGHSLIIPKEHILAKENLDKKVGELALEIQEKIQKTFNPKRIDLISSNVMGHEVINVLPIYTNETIDSEKKKLTFEELLKIKEKIVKDFSKEEEKLEEIKEKQPEINEKKTWLPKRIP